MNSKKYKAVFVDLDGTLLNSKKHVSERNLNCLNQLIEEGIPVFVATGRTIQSTRKVTAGLNLITPVVTINGADIRSSLLGYSMMAFYFQNHEADSIIQVCKILNEQSDEIKLQNILIDTGNGFYVLNKNMSAEEFREHYDDLPQTLDLNNPPSDRIMSFLFLADERDKLLETLEKQLERNLNICQFNGWAWIEVTPPKVNKATAMELLCEEFSIPIESVVAFGDGANDKEMLARAGLGVAMANADSFALNAAKVQTLSNDEDGVAVFLENLRRDSLI